MLIYDKHAPLRLIICNKIRTILEILETPKTNIMTCIIDCEAFFYEKRKGWQKLPATKYVQLSRRQGRKKAL